MSMQIWTLSCQIQTAVHTGVHLLRSQPHSLFYPAYPMICKSPLLARSPLAQIPP